MSAAAPPGQRQALMVLAVAVLAAVGATVLLGLRSDDGGFASLRSDCVTAPGPGLGVDPNPLRTCPRNRP